ncbi:RloB family protein [Desulfovibrio sp. JC022]|uniref:RloB family protein n=1 Tax=Desulfovibrio sp. JC022 TaxID=2593642 RepID=UPI0013D6A994|nr:RloB family protein [Desulfovibrio sp. JC022]NDV22834.1 RloB domain-containing protein [Desulfovibrio sp. JC022]
MARPKRPSKSLRRKKVNVLLVCDGQTEQNYAKFVLNECLSSKNNPVVITPKTFTLVDQALRYMDRDPKDFDAVLFLRDLENDQLSQTQINNLKAELEQITKLGKKKKEKRKWAVFYNYPAIEIWYALHFCDKINACRNAGDSERQLKAVFSAYEKPMPRNKKEAEVFCINMDDAIKRSKSLNITAALPYANQLKSHKPLTNPMTEMPELIEFIKKVKPIS